MLMIADSFKVGVYNLVRWNIVEWWLCFKVCFKMSMNI